MYDISPYFPLPSIIVFSPSPILGNIRTHFFDSPTDSHAVEKMIVVSLRR